MNKKYIFFLIFVASTIPATVKEKKVVTFISPRSQSTNAARELVGWNQYVNIYTNNNSHGSLAIIPEVTRSFRPERIAQCLFGDDVIECKNTFTVAGSRVKSRDKTDDWLADYFGLPTDFQSKVHLEPEIINFLVDFDFFIGLDRITPGLYIKAHAPVVYTRWDLRLTETVINKGSNGYDPGYFNTNEVPRKNLLNCFLSFIDGSLAPTIENISFQKITAAKMSRKFIHTTKLSDIQIALGYNIIDNEQHHFGFNLRGTIPTGTRPKGAFLFEPIVGNGHHPEIGIGLSGHTLIWERESTAERVMFHADINIIHPLTICQCRSFDLACKPNSRYMLAAKMKKTIDNNLQGDSKQPSLQFDNEFTSVVNLTTFNVDISIQAEVDAAAMITYVKDKFNFNFGYSFWARSCEHIALHKPTPLDCQDTWVLKGDAHMFGFMGASDGILNAGDPITLSSSQSKADVHTGKNFPDLLNDIDAGKKNPNIDNPRAATAGQSNTRLLFEPGIANTATNQINTSIQPIVLTKKNIDLHSARTRGVSHKIFGHFTRSWTKRKTFIPHLGFGAEVEFGRRAGPTPPKEKAKCVNCAFSHWGVWAKAGFSYQ